jgi:hypothetical protein
MELIEFIFSSFWVFVGFAILLSIVMSSIVAIVECICRPFKLKSLNKLINKIEEKKS